MQPFPGSTDGDPGPSCSRLAAPTSSGLSDFWPWPRFSCDPGGLEVGLRYRLSLARGRVGYGIGVAAVTFLGIVTVGGAFTYRGEVTLGDHQSRSEEREERAAYERLLWPRAGAFDMDGGSGRYRGLPTRADSAGDLDAERRAISPPAPCR